jgi:hypothetical protein
VVSFERLEWHRSGENEACRMSKGQKSHLLADPTEKTARTAESSLGLAKDLGATTLPDFGLAASPVRC